MTGHSDRALPWQIAGRDVRPATLFLSLNTGPVTEPDDEGERRRTYSLEIGLAKIEGKLDAMIAVQT